MALTTYHSTTDVEEVIPTEKINSFIERTNFKPQIAQAIAWISAGIGTIPDKQPRINAFTYNGVAQTEGNDLQILETDTTEESITPGVLGWAFRVSDQAEANASPILGLSPELILVAVDTLWETINDKFCAASTSATQITGAETDVLDVDKFLAAQSAYQALNITSRNGMHAAVLGSDAMGDLVQSLGGSAASILTNPDFMEMFGPESGYKGTLFGQEIFTTTAVTTTGAGRSNFMTPIGDQNSGLGIVMSKPPRIEVSRGDLMQLALGTQYTITSWAGFGLKNRLRLVEVLGRD